MLVCLNRVNFFVWFFFCFPLKLIPSFLRFCGISLSPSNFAVGLGFFVLEFWVWFLPSPPPLDFGAPSHPTLFFLLQITVVITPSYFVSFLS